MSNKAKAPINRIRPFETKSPRVRRYAVSIRLTKDGDTDFQCRERARLWREFPHDDRLLTASALSALTHIHDLPGIVHSLTRPFEINITLADAYNWDEVHDDIINVLKTALFPEGAEVTVEAVCRLERSVGSVSRNVVPSVPTPAELAARQALGFKRTIDASLPMSIGWRAFAGAWINIYGICSTALEDVRAQLEKEGYATALEPCPQRPEVTVLVIRAGDCNVIRDHLFSRRLEKAMDADFPGPFVIPICDASLKHLRKVSSRLLLSGWQTERQDQKVDGIVQPCMVISSLHSI